MHNDTLLTPLSLSRLHPSYTTRLHENLWDEYIAELCADGLRWWFTMDAPSLAAHLAPLTTISPEIQIPSRIRFLQTVLTPGASIEFYDTLYATLINGADFEGAAALTTAAIRLIIEDGMELGQLAHWQTRINELTEGHGLSPEAMAALLLSRTWLEILCLGSPAMANETVAGAVLWAEKSALHGLRILAATTQAYTRFYGCEFSRVRTLLADCVPLCARIETPFICKVVTGFMGGLLSIQSGESEKAREVLGEIITHPLYDTLSPLTWLTGISHLIFAVTSGKTDTSSEELRTRMSSRTVPDANSLFHGYTHFTLGVSHLLAGEPDLTLLHAGHCREKNSRNGSPALLVHVDLLSCQALADLHRDREAGDHLIRFLNTWANRGYVLLLVTAMIELARIQLRQGKIREARNYYESALTLLPEGNLPVPAHRDRGFLEGLRHFLYPVPNLTGAIHATEQIPIRIETLGDFRIHLGNETLYDRKWKNRTTKNLLKALIVFGGEKVSSSLLMDTLWPDSDGDTAWNNLKVALSRLRKTCTGNDKEPMQWIAVKHKHVSLARSLCSVDSIVFQDLLAAYPHDTSGNGRLLRALDLYKDDFLAHDDSEPWIVNHRELLRELFIRGVFTLFDSAADEKHLEMAIPYLQKAARKDPLNEGVYARLMRGYLTMGYPAKAVQTYRQAETILKRELGIIPGSTLLILMRTISRAS